MIVRTLFIILLLAPAASHGDVISGSMSDIQADIFNGGNGSNPSNDYFGIVTSNAPLQINGDTGTTINSAFSPVINDIIGRDLVSAGVNMTDGSAVWSLNLPAIAAGYIANTFNYSASFVAEFDFNGPTFSGPQPNALDFDLMVDGVVVDSFQVQSGNHTDISLAAAGNLTDPIANVQVVMTFPTGSSFNGGGEQFHIFNSLLSLNFNYETIPEPGTAAVLLLLSGLTLRRRR